MIEWNNKAINYTDKKYRRTHLYIMSNKPKPILKRKDSSSQ